MKLEMQFEGMTCLECAKNLERALHSVPGVESARVSYLQKRGTVQADEGVSRDMLLRVVEETGYRAEIVSDRGDAVAAVRERTEPAARKASAETPR